MGRLPNELTKREAELQFEINKNAVDVPNHIKAENHRLTQRYISLVTEIRIKLNSSENTSAILPDIQRTIKQLPQEIEYYAPSISDIKAERH